MPVINSSPYKVADAPSYNILGATYDNKSYDNNPPNTNSFDLFFKPDGTKMYLVDGNNGAAKVTQHTLAVAWDVSTASYDTVLLSLQALEPNAYGLFFKPDGTALYVVGGFNDLCRQFTLSSAWDLSTALHTSSFWMKDQDNSVSSIYIKPDGTKMYLMGNSENKLFQYTLSTPWLVSGASASYDGVSKAFAASVALYGANFRDDGLAFYTSTISTDLITQYTLSSAWNISTITGAGSLNVNPPANGNAGIRWKSDGTKFYTGTPGGDFVYQFSVNN